ncbi:hypothetical protein AMATHDRAFT_40043 [Amanita thiersii Skay4041]|uniref:C2H2-type domain-containing protein n=1 Tax=Amanita thiersii Skay4041 TaxID=703135 RepID=A0A2A9NM39_9AGAR|nr:hypothetical protein AMATHDRAFT_40043 [Amanita thiersii Skay4041]
MGYSFPKAEYTCPRCHKKMCRANAWRHSHTHNPNAQRYPCTFEGCKYQTLQKFDLKAHMKTHTGIKPYKCRVCSWESAYKRSVRKHEEFRHGIGAGPLENAFNVKCYQGPVPAGKSFSNRQDDRAHSGTGESYEGAGMPSRHVQESASMLDSHDSPDYPSHRQTPPPFSNPQTPILPSSPCTQTDSTPAINKMSLAWILASPSPSSTSSISSCHSKPTCLLPLPSPKAAIEPSSCSFSPRNWDDDHASITDSDFSLSPAVWD